MASTTTSNTVADQVCQVPGGSWATTTTTTATAERATTAAHACTIVSAARASGTARSSTSIARS
jgi:hypothetical protein